MLLLYFHSDEGTICGENKFDRDENFIPHPYDCGMYIICTMDHTFVREDYVYREGFVLKPGTMFAVPKSDVACANQESKSI